jgi:guanylate kinase
METKYQIVALIGKAGAGKDSIQKTTCELHPLMFHPIVSCTTRPAREGEIEGIDYHFISLNEFTRKVLNGDMLEATEFRDWFYGTTLDSLSKDKINIGVFNPAGVEALLEDSRLNVIVFEVTAPDKQRLMRYLNREEVPDCAEMCRRYFTDEKDFSDLDFDRYQIDNWDGANLDLIDAYNSCFDTLEEMWNDLNVDTQFETIMRWEASMNTKKAELDDDKVNND